MNLLAHLTDIDGVRTEQTLKEHCFHTAEYAAGSIGNPGLYHTIYLAGLLHDMGKARKEYLHYLEDAYSSREVVRGSVNHTFTGAIWLLEKYHTDQSTIWEKMTCEVICFAIGSHHGMFDCVDLNGKNGFVHRLKKDRQELGYEEAVHNYLEQVAPQSLLEEYFQKAVQEVMTFFQTVKDTYGTNAGEKVFFQISMLARLVLSAVIYGDRRDTSEFMNSAVGVQESGTVWRERVKYYEEKITRFDASTLLNQVRSDISRQCLEVAERESGVYRLNVPTGAGKTLSVLDQNVKVIREYVSDQSAVLEHHSNVIYEKAMAKEADSYEFLGESWNYPIVVSTMVQFLDIQNCNNTQRP